MMETMEQYMSKTHRNYGSGVTRPKINDKTHFELKGQFLKELRENTFSGSGHKDANEHIKKSLRSLTYFISPRLNVPTRHILDSKGAIHTKIAADVKPISTTSGAKLMRKYTLLRSDANYAKDHTTRRTVHSRKKGKLLKRLTTHSLEHPINMEDIIEQQGQDSTNTTTEILHTLNEDKLWRNH
ncbi:hypothetical protein Tco_0015017 [Tanacetum coccineum]